MPTAQPVMYTWISPFLTVLCCHCSGSGAGSARAEVDRSEPWIHITQRERHGLKELVEFLDNLDTADRHVPSELQSPDELLATAKVTNM